MRRTVSVLLSLAVFAAGLILLSYREELLLDEAYSLFVITVLFLTVFFLSLRHDRLRDQLSYNGTSYRKFTVVFAVCFALCFLGTYVSDFFFPIVIIALLLTSVMDGKLSLAMTVYFACAFAIVTGGSIF